MFSRTAFAASLLLAAPAWAQDQAAQPVSATATSATTTTAAPNAPTAATPNATTASANPPVYTRDTPVEKIAADPAAAAVLNKDLPGLLSDSSYPLFKGMSLHALQQASGGDLSAEDVDKAVADLQALFPQ